MVTVNVLLATKSEDTVTMTTASAMVNGHGPFRRKGQGTSTSNKWVRYTVCLSACLYKSNKQRTYIYIYIFTNTQSIWQVKYLWASFDSMHVCVVIVCWFLCCCLRSPVDYVLCEWPCAGLLVAWEYLFILGFFFLSCAHYWAILKTKIQAFTGFLLCDKHSDKTVIIHFNT